jgi:hypothetical protein
MEILVDLVVKKIEVILAPVETMIRVLEEVEEVTEAKEIIGKIRVEKGILNRVEVVEVGKVKDILVREEMLKEDQFVSVVKNLVT